MDILGHLRTINEHRMEVMKGCFRLGLFWQGITHDLSKYSPSEFLVGVKYYQGYRSPNNAEREKKGYSAAWLHHKGRNKHHYEYWIDYTSRPVNNEGTMVPVRMPARYLAEMYADRVAASKIYNKDHYDDSFPLKYYLKGNGRVLINEETNKDLEILLRMLALKGERATEQYIRTQILKGMIGPKIVELKVERDKRVMKKMANKYKAIMFDMDGTLVPMNMEEFTNGYFEFLCKKLKKYGYDDKELIKTVWAGTKAMAKNDGTMSNRDRFWDNFKQTLGGNIEEIDKDCIDFYSNEFQQAKQFTQDNPLAVEAVELARSKADIVALATNPLFPMVGNDTRMSWVGLKRDDFDLVTSYETDSYCKPNPKYFITVCERLGVDPKECLMVGNDEYEDMYCASSIGIDCYLITDTMIPSQEHPWEGKKGTFAEFVEFLKSL